jgi:hypothetical protein
MHFDICVLYTYNTNKLFGKDSIYYIFKESMKENETFVSCLKIYYNIVLQL